MVDLALLQSISYIVGALGVGVAAFYYIFILRINVKTQQLTLKAQEQTLETRQTQLMMNLYQVQMTFDAQKSWTDTFNREWTSYEDFIEKYGQKNNPEAHIRRVIVLSFYESIGFLLKNHLINPNYAYELNRTGIIRMWEKYADLHKEMRVKLNDPEYAANFEYAYNEMMKLRKDKGLTSTMSKYF